MNCSGDAERRVEEERGREPLAVQWQQTAAEVGGGGGGGRKVVAEEEQKASEGQPSPPRGNGTPKLTPFSEIRRVRRSIR